MVQLPGLAVQRLMADGYGFGAEGDWKTAALVRTMKVMGDGLPGGTSFMEDYTYDFSGAQQNWCSARTCWKYARPSPAANHRSKSIRSVSAARPIRRDSFSRSAGNAVVASLIDLGNRFRLVVNDIESVPPPSPLPKLPVARVVWAPKPDFKTAAAAWILAGGAHHSGYSRAITIEHLTDYAEIAGIELLHINGTTCIPEFKKEIRSNEVYYLLSQKI